MKERPVIFSDPMIRAILAGRKTQTRRVIVAKTLLWLTDPATFYKARRDDRNGFSEPAAQHHKGAGWFWYEEEYIEEGGHVLFRCPYGQKGDRLYVREAYHFDKEYDADSRMAALRASAVPPIAKVHYAADGRKPDWAGRRRPSIHQPKWASRILLEVQEIQVERVREMTDKDAIVEGAFEVPEDMKQNAARSAMARGQEQCGPVDYFAWLWDTINEHRGYGWEANPWVWVVKFKVLQKERIRA